jgi:hypothetical protein
LGSWVVGDGVAGCKGKIGEVRKEVAASLGEEGFSEVNGGGGVALEEGVEEDVGVEGWGACDGGDGGGGGGGTFCSRCGR